MTAGGRSVLSKLVPIIPVILVIAGLALLTSAAWYLAVPAGLAVAGLSCFALQWYLVDGMKA